MSKTWQNYTLLKEAAKKILKKQIRPLHEEQYSLRTKLTKTQEALRFYQAAQNVKHYSNRISLDFQSLLRNTDQNTHELLRFIEALISQLLVFQKKAETIEKSQLSEKIKLNKLQKLILRTFGSHFEEILAAQEDRDVLSLNITQNNQNFF